MNKVYKVITILTLLMPTSIYLFISSVINDIKPTCIIENVEINEISVFNNEGYIFIYTDNKEALISGNVAYNEDCAKYGVYISGEDILQIDKEYYGFKDNLLTNVKNIEMQKQTSYRVPVTLAISLMGVALAFLIISKKMEWAKLYPRISVLASLIFATGTLYLINTVVSNLLNVFIMATISWALYMVEYFAYNNIISAKEAQTSESQLLSLLKEGLGGK